MPPIIEALQDKSIAIMGFGREGRSVYRYLRTYLPNKQITIADCNTIEDSSLTHVEFHCGEHYQHLESYDIVIKSPGIVLEDDIDLSNMSSMTNLFLLYYGKQTIGITGTKGKSTTSSLLFHLLRKNGKKVVFLGNIGKPAFDALEDIEEDTIVVFELSCHQLEYVTCAPHVAVLLNIYEEHLDHYGTFEKYVHAKENIWRNQKQEDLLLCEASLVCDEIPSQVVRVSMQDAQADIFAQLHDIQILKETIHFEANKNPLLGHHNLYDIAIDFYLANRLYQISYEDCKKALESFQPLPHRLQYVGEYHGIHWYDDSISTICETTIQALKTLPQTTTLLVGGMDRGIDYTPLATYLKQHPIPHIIAMPDSGEVLAKLMENETIHHVADLKEAVRVAISCTSKGGLVLLSPAAASYGFFKDFEERGNQYQIYLKEE